MLNEYIHGVILSEEWKERDSSAQEAKEEAIVLALNLEPPRALSRNGLDMELISADGSKELLVSGTSYESLWHESLEALKLKR